MLLCTLPRRPAGDPGGVDTVGTGPASPRGRQPVGHPRWASLATGADVDPPAAGSPQSRLLPPPCHHPAGAHGPPARSPPRRAGGAADGGSDIPALPPPATVGAPASRGPA